MKEQQRPTFTRNAKFLGIVIALASAVLVVAAVVLMMLNSPGDFSTVPRITKVTSPASSVESDAPSSSTTGAEETSTTSPTSSETSESQSPAPASAQRIPEAPHGADGNHAPSFHPTPGVG